MKQIRRRTARAILIPFALFAIVLGGALPASADTGSTPTATYSCVIGPFSLNW